MEGRRIGILGGSFDPIHAGHLILAQDALELFELDEIVFVPCFVPAHKDPDKLASFRHRLAMTNAAIEHDFRFSVSDVEQRRGGTSYAIDTVRGLQAENPDAHYYFIIGADTLFELHTWHKIVELLALCEFVILSRPGFSPHDQGEIQLPPPWPERLLKQWRQAHQVDISSTDIRMRVAEGMWISYLVPAPVEMYIAEHRLYLS